MQIFTQPSLGKAESGLSENLHYKSPPFLTKWFDPLDLSYRKKEKLLDMLFIDPRGVREGTALIFLGKGVFEKHPNEEHLKEIDQEEEDGILNS